MIWVSKEALFNPDFKIKLFFVENGSQKKLLTKNMKKTEPSLYLELAFNSASFEPHIDQFQAKGFLLSYRL